MEVSKVKKGFGGICYRLGKPINVEAIEAGITQSDQEAYDRSQEIRNGTVAAQDHIFATSAQEMGVKQVGGPGVYRLLPKYDETVECLATNSFVQGDGTYSGTDRIDKNINGQGLRV